MADPKAPVVSEVKAPPATPGISPIKARLHEKLKAIPKEDLEQATVWYGTKKDCPFVNYGVGGVTFASMVYTTRIAAHGAPDVVIPHDGNLHKMTKVRIDEVVEAVGRHIFRNISGRVEQWDVTHKDYVQDAADVPVGRYLYMITIKDGVQFERSAEIAPAMA